ncbi:MAG TPA: heme o synthase [Candidatus Saccharimonadales bacterium]|nr:heme o synthase [Candidatus Saccharimonadales bacterium]
MFKKYYRLTKPGIVYGNDLAAIGAFFFGSAKHIDATNLAGLAIGLALVIASACVFNNYLDRGIDSKMSRTQKRALVKGEVSTLAAIIYAVVLGVAGLTILLVLDNGLSATIALAGMILYVVVYGIAKRTTVYSTLVGSLSGSTPPLIGYTAATGHLDLAAWLLFAIMTAWQMPHFYAIAMFRRDDYKAANLPIWSVAKGFASTKKQIILWTVIFTLTCAALSIFSSGGWMFGLGMCGLGIYWLYVELRPNRLNSVKWSRKVFGLSLMMLLVLSVAWAINPWLP